MRDDQQCINALFAFLIILTLMCVCAMQAYPEAQIRIRDIELDWGEIFNKPYEILVFIFDDFRTGIAFDTQEEHRVNIHPSFMIRELKKRRKTLKDVAIIIHNHPTPARFSIGNNMVFRYLKSEGFDGYFMIFYPFNKKTRVKK